MRNLLLFVIGMSLFSMQAFADQKCKSVNLKVKNELEAEGQKRKIKVNAIYYWDNEDKKWRFENVRDKEISNNKSHTFTESLEYVGNEKVNAFYVKFQYLAGGKWSKTRYSKHLKKNGDTVYGKTECVKNKTYKLTINNAQEKEPTDNP